MEKTKTMNGVLSELDGPVGNNDIRCRVLRGVSVFNSGGWKR